MAGLMALVAQACDVRGVVHALGGRMARHEMMDALGETAAVEAQGVRLEPDVAPATPLPPAMGSVLGLCPGTCVKRRGRYPASEWLWHG